MGAAADIDRFARAFAAAGAGLPGRGDANVVRLREAAMARFAAVGIPDRRRNEGWRYTDLRRLDRIDLESLADAVPGETAAALPAVLSTMDAHRIVFVDGRHDGILPADARCDVLSARLSNGHADAAMLLGSGMAEWNGAGQDGLAALNAAMTRDGLVLDLPAGTVLDKPVLVVHLTSGRPGVVHPRSVLRVGAGAKADLVEVFLGRAGGPGWTNAVLEGAVAEGGRLNHLTLIRHGEGAVHTGRVTMDVARDAGYAAQTLTAGGRIVRNESVVRLSETGASCSLSGAALADGRRHVDHTNEIVHAAPHTDSGQVFRNVVDDNARSVFQGRVVVERDAQKTDARQSSRSLLLAPGAEASNKPELRIFADDVKCSHGVAVGDLDGDALFYLRARGIDEAEARALLTRAFVADLSALLPVAAARPAVEETLDSWLGRAVGKGG